MDLLTVLGHELGHLLGQEHAVDGVMTDTLATGIRHPDKYTTAQLRYDILKLRAKGWVSKLDGSINYVLTPKGMTQGTAIHKLKECLNGTVSEPVGNTPDVGSPQSPLQKEFRKVRLALGALLRVQRLAVA